MNPESLASLVRLVVALVALAISVRALVALWVAEFRHDLFALRRDLFMVMAQGKVPPSHPAYSQLRRTHNGLLAQAEDVTSGRVLLMALVFKLKGRTAESMVRHALEERRAALQDLEPTVRAELLRIDEETDAAVQRHVRRLTYTSPLLAGFLLLRGVVRGTQRLSHLVEADGIRAASHRLLGA